MDPATVPRRTPAGDAAVARHAPELDTATRVVLAAIDGKRAYAALKLRFGALTDLPAALSRLVAVGLIEPLGAGAAAPAGAPGSVAAAPAPSAIAAPAPGIDPVRLRQQMVRGLSEVLGPAGDALALKVERAKTAAELVELHARCIGVVRELRGAGEAERFLQWCPAPGA
jgi:hypothetical protein